MSKHYVLAKAAAADLIEIIRYTNQQWGRAQCLTYISQLEKAADSVAKGEGAFKNMDLLHPQLRMANYGRHFIFCLPRANARPLILAIFHERMDIMARLRGRLT